MDDLQNSTNSTFLPTSKPTPAPPEKKRKPLSADALEKLKVAREKAAESNRRKKQERHAAMQASYDPVVVVEQSDSDPEQLEGPPGVVFVRRKRARPQPERSAEQVEQDRMYARMFGL